MKGKHDHDDEYIRIPKENGILFCENGKVFATLRLDDYMTHDDYELLVNHINLMLKDSNERIKKLEDELIKMMPDNK
jgi:hypothetical protein